MDEDVAQHIVVPVWSSLTPKEIEFLTVMCQHDDPVKSADIIHALGGGGGARAHKSNLLKKGDRRGRIIDALR